MIKNGKCVSKFIVLFFLSLIVALIGIYFMSKKENLDIDEIYTYGLSNSSFQAQIEDFKEYSGKELLYGYAVPNEENSFNISNVVFNQTHDTHPPLYYLLVNFICSIFKNEFSIWHGLLINIVFLVILYFEMAYILNLVIKDKIVPYIVSLISLYTYGFMNEIVFTRMYVMLSVISMAFIILIITKLKNLCDKSLPNVNSDTIKKVNIYLCKDDILFLILYFVLCIVGVLTQYHFAIIAGFFSLVFAIYMIRIKNIKLLLYTFLTGILSIVVSIILFPGIINHLFGDTSLHAINGEQVLSLPTRFYEIFITLYQAFFGVGIYIYLIILLIGIVLYFIFRRKRKINSSGNIQSIEKKFLNLEDAKTLYIIFILCSIFYYVVISITSNFTFARYLYNIYPLIVIIIVSPIYYLYLGAKPIFRYISIILILCLAITSKLESAPFSLNVGDSLFHEFLKNNADTKMILLYRTIDKNGNRNAMGTTSMWKLPRPFYSFKDMKNMTFVDVSYDEKLIKSTSPTISGYDDIFLVIYTTENDDALIREVMKKNNVRNCSKVYFANYFHVYRLSG